MKRPEDDLKARQIAWDAMHVLWLDTDVDAVHLDDAAAQCAQTAYSISELEQIYWQEVYPAMHSNVQSIAGEWAPLALETLSAEILKRHKFSRSTWFKRFRPMANRNWDKLRSRIVKIRSGA